MEYASMPDKDEILDLYRYVIEEVNRSTVKLGWNIESYPDETFVRGEIERGEMCILRRDGRIIASAAVNHNVNPEYDDIDWEVKGPKEQIATIHALCVSPECRGSSDSYAFLADIEAACKAAGDLAIHLDVIDTNVPAYKLYTRNGYRECACIEMYYEVVGTRSFWMMEKVL